MAQRRKPRPSRSKGLTKKRKRFVREVLKDGNASRAARAAGYSPNGAGQMAHELLKIPEVVQAMAAAVEPEVTAQEVIQELRRLAMSDVGDLFDEHGDLKPIHSLTVAQRASIAEVEVVMKNATAGDGHIDRVLKVKRWNKGQALEVLAKHLGLILEKVDHTVRGNLTLNVVQALPDDVLEGELVKYAQRALLEPAPEPTP